MKRLSYLVFISKTIVVDERFTEKLIIFADELTNLKTMKNLSLITGIMALTSVSVMAQTVAETSRFVWHGDTITQGEFYATAPDAETLISTYSAQPGYFMGIEKEWRLKNDISSYPQLETPSRLHTAIYNMGLDEMVNAVEADTTLRTGKEWAGVWTRDVSYSILLSMAYMQPEASMISLMKKVDPTGRIIQDTGSGGAWPVSTDRQIWCVAAWEVYKVTGSRQWLEYIYPVMKKSLETDRISFYDTETGLVKGETSFIDWREQSHPRWMQCADIYNSETLSTSVVHSKAWSVLGEAATILKDKKTADDAFKESKRISDAINRNLWMKDKGYYAMYLYGRDNLIVNPRAETLGESLAILWNIASPERAVSITENNPTTPFGAPVFYPYIADIPSYHNKSLWPWVGAWWALANAKAKNEEGVVLAIANVFRPAALFCTNKENYNIENGDIATELNSSNMLWCLSGNIALTHKILFGIDYRTDGLAFQPFVPTVLGATRTLRNFSYRGGVLDITISGSGDKIRSFRVNGKEQQPFISADKVKGKMVVEIVMDDNVIPPLKVNHVDNLNAPLTPITWFEGNVLHWNPIEYIGGYIVIKDGKEIARTRSTTYDCTLPGEYQVIGVSSDGVEGFASEPRSNRDELEYDFGDVVNDKTSLLDIPVEVPEAGDYFVTIEYANGNGPVNTENKCAIRTLTVDGNRAGLIVMPTRGVENWEDFGRSNPVEVHLDKGNHTLSLTYRPENENMNIVTNRAVIRKLHLVRKSE